MYGATSSLLFSFRKFPPVGRELLFLIFGFTATINRQCPDGFILRLLGSAKRKTTNRARPEIEFAPVAVFSGRIFRGWSCYEKGNIRLAGMTILATSLLTGHCVVEFCCKVP